ncbi:MAG TPA: hypothetical protein PK095_03030, partial [Myxococcota bacterium]|nr:hypothetical protein [Myxococcota bacterium]
MNVAYLLNRQQALSALRSQLLRPDTPEPSLAMSIITGAAAVALAAASAGIGTAVAGALVAGARQVASAMAAEAVKGAVERVVTAGSTAAASSVPSGGAKPCVDAFLYVQEQALGRAALEALQATERQRASFHALAGDEGRTEAERFKLA